jgi:large subunit ribosomal protein L16
VSHKNLSSYILNGIKINQSPSKSSFPFAFEKAKAHISLLNVLGSSTYNTSSVSLNVVKNVPEPYEVCSTKTKFEQSGQGSPFFAKAKPHFVGQKAKAQGLHALCNTRARGLRYNAWLPRVTLASYSEVEHGTTNTQRCITSGGTLEAVTHLNGYSLLFGKFGLAFQSHGKLPSKLIETLRLDISKIVKKKAKIWVRLCCDTPVTARPVETRMGKGKGSISYYETKVRPGMILFEFSGLSMATMKTIHTWILKKSPLVLKLIH